MTTNIAPRVSVRRIIKKSNTVIIKPPRDWNYPWIVPIHVWKTRKDMKMLGPSRQINANPIHLISSGRRRHTLDVSRLDRWWWQTGHLFWNMYLWWWCQACQSSSHHWIVCQSLMSDSILYLLRTTLHSPPMKYFIPTSEATFLAGKYYPFSIVVQDSTWIGTWNLGFHRSHPSSEQLSSRYSPIHWGCLKWSRSTSMGWNCQQFWRSWSKTGRTRLTMSSWP